MTATRGQIDRELRERWGWTPYRVIGGVALFGCAAVLVCDFIMWALLLPDYSPLSGTISELGAGPHHDLQDAGLVLFVIGILALFGGLVLRGEACTRAYVVRGAFLLLAIDITLIALVNEYGDGDTGGMVLHPYFVGALYVLVAVLLWLGPTVEPTKGSSWAKLGRVLAVIWVLTAPFFYMVPDSINGAYERFLGLIMVASVAIAAYELLRHPEH